MRAPSVAVVVPAYNASSFLRRTLETIAAQTFAPAEVVIVDDGSTDDTAAIAEAFAAERHPFRVLVLRESHRGPGATRNAGIARATAEWVAFLDSDDLWAREKLEVVADAIRNHPDVNILCHNERMTMLDGAERIIDTASVYVPSASFARQLFRQNLFSTSAVVCRRDLLVRFGGFDEHLSSSQDYELWLRMSSQLAPMFISRLLGVYVVRPGNISTSNFWRRLRNVLLVKHRHRHHVAWQVYLSSMLVTILLHLGAPMRRLFHRATTAGMSR